MNKYNVVFNMKSGTSLSILFESTLQHPMDVAKQFIKLSVPYFSSQQSPKAAVSIKPSEIEYVQVTAIL